MPCYDVEPDEEGGANPALEEVLRIGVSVSWGKLTDVVARVTQQWDGSVNVVLMGRMCYPTKNVGPKTGSADGA